MKRVRVDPNEVEEYWRARGFSCDLCADAPGAVREYVIHDTQELVMLLDGEIELEIMGNKRRPAIGEEVRISALDMHTVRNVGETTARWLYGYKTKR